METLIESTRRFEKDLKKLDSRDKEQVIKAINDSVAWVEAESRFS
ncbi:type II toxin-antitoxin system RelE family toxin [Sodalinema gerasimenkoae]|nr:hypothetical protein [Sodalinema gerasimenkoae]